MSSSDRGARRCRLCGMAANDTGQRKLVPAPEAFEAMGISRTTGYAGIHDGTLPIDAIRVGGQWKFRGTDLARLLDGPDND